MKMLPALGRITTVRTTDVWQNEPYVFTPWLAQNLDLLAEALDIDELELKGTEMSAGDFRIDILAEDSQGNPVIVENQFGATDHKHLGQLISYVASLSGRATMVWIAERIKEDHRAAIDWLNASTVEDFDFFAIEVAALRIADSVPAPVLRVVAKPNNWARRVGAAAREAASDGLAERHKARIAYWTSFAKFLDASDSKFRIRTPGKDHWHEFPIGRAGFAISCTITMSKQRVGVELYIHSDPLKIAFKQLLAQRESIEAEFGERLDWQDLNGKKGCRIASFLEDVDAADKHTFPRLHTWMLDRMTRFRDVFANRVRMIDLEIEEASEDEAVFSMETTPTGDTR
ncbi:hypothetical protein ASD50_03570 [Mesorhizobium sp. Root552]|uniref:DUF4268 domain-containing protein n=1 Tax=Mesorhizobium sp. Root552 TaxID=1736555 RepID=UPI0006FE1643|nr:DUF4268 domain-containing protein [Mesorhizobium sp. Root552]KQZ26498.1 hypothetical protein ASD50_03570 [Mesorhizobium sp. Root552]